MKITHLNWQTIHFISGLALFVHGLITTSYDSIGVGSIMMYQTKEK